MRLFKTVLAVLAAATLVAAPADAGQPRPPSDPVGALLAAYATHSIVAKSSPDPGPSSSTSCGTRASPPP